MSAPEPLGAIDAVEGLRDAVAFARAFTTGDQDGAYEIYKGRTAGEQMLLAMSLSALLAAILGDSDEAWAILLATVGA